MKRIPLTFVIVVVASVLLTVFFGAWAVSADVEGRDKNFAFGVAIGGSNLAGDQPDPSSETSEQSVGSGENEESPADKWWGKAVLRACPFH